MSKRAIKWIGVLVGFFLIVGIFSGDSQKQVDTKPEIKSKSVQQSSEPSIEPSPPIIQKEKYKVLSVSDGDTLRIEYNGVNTPLRLIGIDTPEINHPSEPIQCYGPEASDKTKELLLGKYIELEEDITDIDKYDRLLRYIWFDGVLINELLVREGYALSSRYPPDTKYQDRLDATQAIAKKERVGFWSPDTCNGDVYTGTYLDPNKVVETPPIVATSPAIPVPTYIPTPPPTSSDSYTCSCSKTCKQMASCEEAYFQLNNCGCSARDGDKDGVPCESICR